MSKKVPTMPGRATTNSNHEDIQGLQTASVLIEERSRQMQEAVAALDRLMSQKFVGVDIQFAALAKALSLAEEEAKKNYFNLNQLREKCITKDVYDQGHRSLEAKTVQLELTLAAREPAIQSIAVHTIRLDSLEGSRSKQEGMASMNAIYVTWVGILVSAAIGIASLIHSFMK